MWLRVLLTRWKNGPTFLHSGDVWHVANLCVHEITRTSIFRTCSDSSHYAKRREELTRDRGLVARIDTYWWHKSACHRAFICVTWRCGTKSARDWRFLPPLRWNFARGTCLHRTTCTRSRHTSRSSTYRRALLGNFVARSLGNCNIPLLFRCSRRTAGKCKLTLLNTCTELPSRRNWTYCRSYFHRHKSSLLPASRYFPRLAAQICSLARIFSIFGIGRRRLYRRMHFWLDRANENQGI